MGLSSGILFLRMPPLHVCGIRFLQRPPDIPTFGTGFPAWHAFTSPFLFDHEGIPSGIPHWKTSSGFRTRYLPCLKYCRQVNITPFIDLNPGHTGHFTYKDDFTIDDDGVLICKMGLRMHKDGYEAAKHRAKCRCPKANRKYGCFCEYPCSPAKYGRTVHIFTDDNPR